MADDDGFLTRWSRRKVQSQRSPAADEPVAGSAPANTAVETEPPATAAGRPATEGSGPREAAAPLQQGEPAPPAPTLAEAQGLTPDADFTRFVGREVDPQVRNTALKSLFSDPHFNVMDGLDIYIDDYGKPDPLPPGMLRQMAASAMLGLFADERTPNPPAAGTPGPQPASAPPSPTAATQPDAPSDEDTDLRLQPDDDAGRAGTRAGAGEDPGRQL